MPGMMLKLEFCFILLIATVFLACSNLPEDSPSVAYPIARGTFIQDNLVSRWDDAQWQEELAALKEVGMHYLVFAPTLHTDENGTSKTMYKTSLPGVVEKYQLDLVENCLRNAKKAGFKVFLGLNFNERWWRVDFSAAWLFEQMELGNRLADDLTRRYKDRYNETLYGWYWVWEVDNLNCTTSERQDILAQALNINIDHLNQITPDMPFMLCPFVNYRVGNSKDNSQMWQYVFSKTHFREGDIFAPQDCVGAGGLEVGMVKEWFCDMNAAVKSKPGLLFWSDAETFDHRFWTSAPLDRFVEQMNAVKPYVSEIITFAYSHYYSPLQVNKSFHERYLEYVKTGSLPLELAPKPVKNLHVSTGQKAAVTIQWQESSAKENLAGYYIYKNGSLIGNLQYKNEKQIIDSFQDKNPGETTSDRYEVRAYKSTGVVSEPVIVVWNK